MSNRLILSLITSRPAPFIDFHNGHSLEEEAKKIDKLSVGISLTNLLSALKKKLPPKKLCFLFSIFRVFFLNRYCPSLHTFSFKQLEIIEERLKKDWFLAGRPRLT